MKETAKKRFLHSSLVFGIFACFLFVTSALTTQMVQHSAHHAKHKAKTHATSICSWMCAAGQILQAIEIGINKPFLTYVALEQDSPSTRAFPHLFTPVSRGPPTSATILV